MTASQFSVPAARLPLSVRMDDAALPAAATRPVEGGEIDPIHLECAAALTIVRAGFDQAHGRVGVEAARFAADCARLTALIDGEGAA